MCALLSVLASALADVSTEKLLFLSLLVQVELCEWTTLVASTHTHTHIHMMAQHLAGQARGRNLHLGEKPHHHFLYSVVAL